MVLKYFVTILTVIQLLCLSSICFGQYTEKEQKAISKVRSAVENDLYQDYMHTDDYLYSWLQTRAMDVRTTIDAVRRAMKWRKEMKLESIIPNLNCNSDFPIDTDTVGKNGQPVMTLMISQWDWRKHILAGKSERVVLCILRMFEVMYSKIQEQNVLRQAEGKQNVTKFTWVETLQGYNLRQHACLGCIPAIVTGIVSYDQYYPGIIDKLILVNTPTIFDNLFQIMKAALSERTRNIFVVHGLDKSKWSTELFKIIPKEQLPPAFGGTKQ